VGARTSFQLVQDHYLLISSVPQQITSRLRLRIAQRRQLSFASTTFASSTALPIATLVFMSRCRARGRWTAGLRRSRRSTGARHGLGRRNCRASRHWGIDPLGAGCRQPVHAHRGDILRSQSARPRSAPGCVERQGGLDRPLAMRGHHASRERLHQL